MSEQNNNQQSYPGQGYQQTNSQGYPQRAAQPQGYQQANQQGYPQQAVQPQGYQQMNQQGYPTQGAQSQGYQRPAGGGTKPPQGNKPKTGLIVGIVIAVIALIAGIVLLIFKDKIFGSDEDKKTTEATIDVTEDILTPDDFNPDETTEATTEIAVEIEGGYDTPDDLITNFWEGYEYCDKEQMYQCFYLEDELGAASAETNYNNAVAKQNEILVHVDEITATFEDCGVEVIADIGVTVVATKTCHIEVPMQQIVEGDIYDIIDIYDGTIFQLENGKWYLGDIAETDVEIVGVTSGDDGSHDDAGSESTVDETMYLGYGDLKPMGDSICGYVDVPSNWVIFQEIGGIEGADYYYQMSNPEGTAIITMCAYDSDLSAYDAACNLYEATAAEGNADEVISAQATIGGYDAYQVYAVYGTDYLVMYTFEAEDGRLHYIAVEFPEELINIALNVEGTFRFQE